MDGTQYLIVMASLWTYAEHLRSVDLESVAEAAGTHGTAEDIALLEVLIDAAPRMPVKGHAIIP